MFLLYILDGQTPVSTEDPEKWGQWMQTANRKVASTEINGMLISTVFLGIDHAFNPGDPSLLFKTMIFADKETPHREFCRRYSTWAEAQAGHVQACEMVKTGDRGLNRLKSAALAAQEGILRMIEVFKAAL
jgi:hypothetical protein